MVGNQRKNALIAKFTVESFVQGFDDLVVCEKLGWRRDCLRINHDFSWGNPGGRPIIWSGWGCSTTHLLIIHH